MSDATPTLAADLTRRLAPLLRAFGRRRARVGPEAVLRAARGTMARKRFCVLATRSEAGVDARVLQPHPPGDDLSVWLGTSAHSRKAAQLERCPEATLVYEDDVRAACVVLTGSAQRVADPEERRRRFMPSWWTFFPAGPDGDFALLHFVPQRLEVIDFGRRVTPEPFGLRAAVLVRSEQGWVAA